MPKPRIAVLLAAHQPGPELEAQLQTILAQDHVDVRVYVGHDSVADAADLRSRLALPGIRLVYSQAIGSAAQNFFQLIRSVDFSRYDYVALSDQDDLWRSDKLHRAVQVLGDRDQPKGYSANVQPFYGEPANQVGASAARAAAGVGTGGSGIRSGVSSGIGSGASQQVLVKSQPQRAYDGFFESAGPGCTYVMTRALAVSLQGWLVEQSDSALRQVERHDWLIYAWARARGHAWQIDPSVVMDYRQHAHNVVGAHWGLKASWHRLQQVRRGWYRAQVLALAALVDPCIQDRLRSGGVVDRLNLAWQGRRRLRDRLALCSFVLLGWV